MQPNPKVLSVRGCIGKKNSSSISTRDSANIGYISKRQPSFYELTFEVEVGLSSNPHSKRLH